MLEIIKNVGRGQTEKRGSAFSESGSWKRGHKTIYEKGRQLRRGGPRSGLRGLQVKCALADTQGQSVFDSRHVVAL